MTRHGHPNTMMELALADARGTVCRLTLRSGVQLEGVISSDAADLDTVHLTHTDRVGWTTVLSAEIVAVSALRRPA